MIKSFIGPGTYEESSSYIQQLRKDQAKQKGIGALKPRGLVKVGRNLIQPVLLDSTNPA
jgi:hypothetical protein